MGVGDHPNIMEEILKAAGEGSQAQDVLDFLEKNGNFGGVSERLKELVLKTSVGKSTVGSNPTSSAVKCTNKK